MSVVRCRVLEMAIGWSAIGEGSLGGVAELTLPIADAAEVVVAADRVARHLEDSRPIASVSEELLQMGAWTSSAVGKRATSSD